MAFAGGFEIPDNGTEELARGGAFTAKADSPMAIEYNVAGLARQRGTNVELGLNVLLNDLDFTRAGTYPGTPGDPNTPGAGLPYSRIGNTGGPFVAPMIAASSDFGYFDRWTFAFGVYGPSSVGNRQFPLTVGTLPAPQRYDLTKSNLLIIYPTFAAAVRATRWLDIGLELQLVYGNFDLANIAILDLGNTTCKVIEYPPCDAPNHLSLNGFTAAGALGILARPIRHLAVGLNVRSPVYLDASGTVDSPGSQKLMAPVGMPNTGPVSSFKSTLPWVVRFGARWIFEGADKFEHGDIEFDAIYEAWSMAQGDGVHLTVDSIGPLNGFQTILLHNYQDTFGLRLGGSYNVRLPQGVLHLRAGGYYDSNATRYKDTRLDFDTMAKWAGTVGVGYSIRGVTINIAYAYVWSPDRNVQNGDLVPLNGTNGTGQTAEGVPYPAVNNGLYHSATQIVSAALLFRFNELLKRKRVIRYE